MITFAVLHQKAKGLQSATGQTPSQSTHIAQHNMV